MRKLVRVCNSEDPVIIAGAAASLGLRERAAKISAQTGLPVPDKPKGPHNAWRKVQKKKWKAQPTQGKGVSCYQHRLGNKWLGAPSFLTENDYIWAIKLRTNLVPTRETMGRGIIGRNQVECRHCHTTIETMGHISGYCQMVLDIRLIRHNRICKALIKAATATGLRVTEEPRLVGTDGKNYLPDLIFSAGAGEPCYVVDPTVVWDDDPKKLREA